MANKNDQILWKLFTFFVAITKYQNTIKRGVFPQICGWFSLDGTHAHIAHSCTYKQTWIRKKWKSKQKSFPIFWWWRWWLRCYSNNRPIFTIDLFGLGYKATALYQERRKVEKKNASSELCRWKEEEEKEHMLTIGIIRNVYTCVTLVWVRQTHVNWYKLNLSIENVNFYWFFAAHKWR